MEILEEIYLYIKELIETIKIQPKKILYSSFLLWISFPIILFGIWGILEVIFYMKLDLNIFINLFTEAMIPWWFSILINFKNFLLEFSLSFIIIVILIRHKILEPSNPN